MQSNEPIAITTFCDDIRYETNGKYSLIGIYREDLVFHGAFPFTLPKLALSVMLLEHPSRPLGNMLVKIALPGDPEDDPPFVATIETNIEPVPDAAADNRRVLNFHLFLTPCILRQQGRISVRIHRPDGLIVKAGTLLVRSRDSMPSVGPAGLALPVPT